MDITLSTARRQGLKFSRLNFFIPRLVGVKKVVALFLIFLFSLLLASCGGGSGPGDEGENYTASENLSSQNLYSATAGEAVLLDSAQQTKTALATAMVSWCQAGNTWLCENFEWSSSLAYQASEQDWQLKGWQFNSNAQSSIDCNSAGAGGSQCALKWVQGASRSSAQQTARYVFAEYGSSYSKIMLSWDASWSANWVWDAVSNPHVSLETLNPDFTQTAFLSLGFDPAGFVEIAIAEDKSCGRDKRIIKSDIAMLFNNTEQAQWFQFQLSVEIVDSRYNDAGNTNTVQLSINGDVVLHVTDIDLNCVSTASANMLAYLSNSSAPVEQTVLIDNILLSLQ